MGSCGKQPVLLIHRLHSLGFGPLKRAFLILSMLMSVGCSSEIGDSCSSNADCGRGRICDLASRAGYCTITPCGPNSCPANSVCVTFENTESYCMGLCESDEDCRGGYVCDEELGPAPVCAVAD